MSLLDTGTLLWALTAPERLSLRARRAVEAPDALLSVATYWEVVIKVGKGLLPIADPVSWWSRASDLFGGRVLPIRPSHVTALASLPDVHKDPVDRILIAQAVAEGLAVVTSDRVLGKYPVRVVW